jgi:hypothetical protein
MKNQTVNSIQIGSDLFWSAGHRPGSMDPVRSAETVLGAPFQQQLNHYIETSAKDADRRSAEHCSAGNLNDSRKAMLCAPTKWGGAEISHNFIFPIKPT